MTAAAWSPSSATKTLTRHLKINAFDSQTDFQMYKEQEQEQQQQQKTCQAQQSVNVAGSSFNKITRLAATPTEAAADEDEAAKIFS